MNKFGLAVTLALPAIMAACAQTPPPPPAPVLSPGETACAAAAAQAAGVEAAEVIVTPTTSTKDGSMVYTATVGGATYTCVVAPDQTVSSFTMM